MNNSVYMASNDAFDIDIPAFDASSVATSMQPTSQPAKPSELEVIADKSFTSFGIMVVCIVVFVLIAYFIKRKLPQPEPYIPVQSNRISANTPSEPPVASVENKNNESSLYRHSSKKRSSLSTPTSINKCIRAFLENTKEN